MKAIGLILSLLLFVQYSCWTPAYAASASFSPIDASGNGGVQAQVPVNKIGSLLLADATAFLNNSTIEVKGKGPQKDNQTLLNGTLLNTQVIGTGSNRILKGIAYFQGGLSLAKLCQKQKVERVQTTSGEVICGTISNVTADGITVATEGGSRRIPASTLQCIDSGCAYMFETPLTSAAGTSTISGEANKIAFSRCTIKAVATRTTRVVQTATPVVTEHQTRKRVVVSIVLLLLVATAIAVPVAVGCSVHHHHHRAPVFFPSSPSTPVSSQLSSTLRSPFFP